MFLYSSEDNKLARRGKKSPARKVVVLDTNVLVSDPYVLFSFGGDDVVIPITVIEELDSFKKELSMRGRRAREVARLLHDLGSQGAWHKGIELHHPSSVEALDRKTAARSFSEGSRAGEYDGRTNAGSKHADRDDLKDNQDKVGGNDEDQGQKTRDQPERKRRVGRLFIFISPLELPPGLSSTADNTILAVALHLMKGGFEAPREEGSTECLKEFWEGSRKGQGAKEPQKPCLEVVLLTQDIHLRIKAQVFGVEALDYKTTSVHQSYLAYTGISDLVLSAEQWDEFINHGRLALKAMPSYYPLEFLRLFVPDNVGVKGLGWVCGIPRARESQGDEESFRDLSRDQELRALPITAQQVWGIEPRNIEQRCALAALLCEEIRLVTLTGMAGTGKTLLAMAAGLYKTTDEDAYHKLLVSRPIFPIGRDIGYLPGDMEQKLHPWMQPIFDSLDFLMSGHRSSVRAPMFHSYRELLDQEMVAVEPLTYIRGRSLAHHYFVVDEAQNLTPHEIKSILTRVGEGTKIVLTGDPQQIDLPYVDSQSNGLVYAIHKFKDQKIAAHVHLEKGERSELAKLSAQLL